MAKKYGRSTKARSKRGTSYGRKKTGKKSYLKPYKKFAKNVRQIAKKVISSQAEDKIMTLPVTCYNTGLTTTYGTISNSPTNWEVRTTFIPGQGLNMLAGSSVSNYCGCIASPLIAINQGLGSGDRIGNSIRVKKFLLRGVVQTDLTLFATTPAIGFQNVTVNTQDGPFVTHMLIYKRKDSLWGPTSSDPSRLLNTGNSAGFIDGSLIGDLYPFNTDAYTIVKHMKFKMANQPVAQVAANYTSDGWGNGYKQAHAFKLYLPTKKVWKYDDTSISGSTPANFPINDNFYVAFWNTNCDNSKINTVTGGLNIYSRSTVSMETVMTFEDF